MVIDIGNEAEFYKSALMSDDIILYSQRWLALNSAEFLRFRSQAVNWLTDRRLTCTFYVLDLKTRWGAWHGS